MIDWGIVAYGIAIGIVVAAPIGPVNLICIRHALKSGFAAGVMSGFGAVLGDGAFAAIAAFSLTVLSNWFISWSGWLQAACALILIVLGIRTILVRPDFSEIETDLPVAHYLATVCTTFFLTITNPATMMGFAAIFGGVDGLVKGTSDYIAATTLVLAVMAGSLLWWVIVARTVSALKGRINSGHLAYINKTMGFLIFVFGLVVAGQALKSIGIWPGGVIG